MNDFETEKQDNIHRLGSDSELRDLSNRWITDVSRHKYSYNFTWMGRPIIQFPQDMVAMQEIIWETRPDLIIETGIAHGGSLIFYASLMELLGGDGQVLGVDIDIREHNRLAIEAHPMFRRIAMIQGSSTDPDVVRRVGQLALGKQKVMVILDSNHTHDHALRELQLYSPLVTRGSYLVVFDTIIEDMPDDFFPDRPWGKGNNPKTAVREFLDTNERFVVDKQIHDKIQISVAPDGYLHCVKD